MTRFAPALCLALLSACSSREGAPPPAARVDGAGALTGLVAKAGTLPVAMRRPGAPERITAAADQDPGTANPVLWYDWGRDTTVVPGRLTAFVRGDTIFDLMLEPEDGDSARVLRALGGELSTVHFAPCPDAEATYRVPDATGGGALTELADGSRRVSVRIGREGRVREITWGEPLRHLESRAACPAGRVSNS